MKDLLIFPFNGNGLEALNCLGNEFNFIGFIDDTKEKHGKNDLGFRVYSRQAINDFPNAAILAVPGSPTSFAQRKQIIEGLNIEPSRFATVIHPKAEISTFARIGKNALIMSGVVLTANCVVGDHVCILPNTVVHHDSRICDWTLLGSNVTVAGNTTIQDNCYIGSGTSVINGIVIGENCLVGMATTVIKNIPAGSKVVGSPARLL